jgi:hypothetical protein
MLTPKRCIKLNSKSRVRNTLEPDPLAFLNYEIDRLEGFGLLQSSAAHLKWRNWSDLPEELLTQP